MTNPVECLLRPAVEINVGIIHGALALVAFKAPALFMMTPSVGTASAGLLLVSAAVWVNKGWRVVKYQRHLNKLPLFEMALDKIPKKKKHEYLGRGFQWKEIHTQRLHDTRRTKFQQYVKPSWIQNPFKKSPPGGGNPFLHGVELNEKAIFTEIQDLRSHRLILGASGVGKTRTAELLVAQSIFANNSPVIYIDPKGDSEMMATMWQCCQDAGRADDWMVLHLGYPELSCRYNGIGQINRLTEVATRISGQLDGTGQGAVFKSFAWRFINIVSKALVALGEKPIYETILKHVNNIDTLFVNYCDHVYSDQPKLLELVAKKETEIEVDELPRHLVGRESRVIAWDQVLMSEGCGDHVAESLRDGFKYEKAYFDKIVASLLPLLEKLCTGASGQLLNPDYDDKTDPRPILDWKTVVNQKQVVYIGLAALSDKTVAQAVGSCLFSDLVSYAGNRYLRGDNYGLSKDASSDQSLIPIYADEFSNLVGDDVMIELLNKAGGAGCRITALSQSTPDFSAELGISKGKQMLANFGTLIMLRVQESETAQLLTDKLPMVSVNDLTLVSGYNDSSDPSSEVDFTSRSEDRITTTTVKTIEPADLTSLPKGQAFALIKGGQLWKLRMPLAKVKRHQDFTKAYGAIADDMKARYKSGANWWKQ